MQKAYGALSPQDDKSAFSQLTVRITSRQNYAAYDGKGRVVAGDPSSIFPVTDLWVFERALSDNMSNRCAAIHLAPIAPILRLPFGKVNHIACCACATSEARGSDSCR